LRSLAATKQIGEALGWDEVEATEGAAV